MGQTEADVKKKAYGHQRDAFKKKRDEIPRQIGEKLGEIGDLEKAIKEAHPKIVTEGMLCPQCDTVSRKYKGRTPQWGASGGDDEYVCVICDHCNMDDHPWSRDSLSGVGYNRSAAEALRRV